MPSRPHDSDRIDPTGAFDSDTIRYLLAELGTRLQQRGVEARIFIVGGEAMALAYSRRRITRDIDAVFEPKSVVYEEARRMADDIQWLPADWLNDGVKGLMPDLVASELATETFATPGISVGVASAEYMFAMKASAARSEVDRDDIRTLIDELDIESVDAAFAILERHYSAQRLTPRTQFILEELVSEYLAERADAPNGNRGH